MADDLDALVKKIRRIDTDKIAKEIEGWSAVRDIEKRKLRDEINTLKAALGECEEGIIPTADDMLEIEFQPFFAVWYSDWSLGRMILKAQPNTVLKWFDKWIKENKDDPLSWVDDYKRLLTRKWIEPENKPNV